MRPKKIVLDFEKGKAVGPVADDLKSREIQEGGKNFAGELSLTLIDARKLSYFFYGKNLLQSVVVLKKFMCNLLMVGCYAYFSFVIQAKLIHM